MALPHDWEALYEQKALLILQGVVEGCLVSEVAIRPENCVLVTVGQTTILVEH